MSKPYRKYPPPPPRLGQVAFWGLIIFVLIEITAHTIWALID